MTVAELMAAFGVNNDKDLGDIFGRTNKAVSKWRTVGEVPAAIEKRANELLRAKRSPAEQVMNPPPGTHPVVNDIQIKYESQQELNSEIMRYFTALSPEGKQRTINMAKGFLLKELQDEKED